jgi:hypothetical protein
MAIPQPQLPQFQLPQLQSIFSFQIPGLGQFTPEQIKNLRDYLTTDIHDILVNKYAKAYRGYVDPNTFNVLTNQYVPNISNSQFYWNNIATFRELNNRTPTIIQISDGFSQGRVLSVYNWGTKLQSLLSNYDAINGLVGISSKLSKIPSNFDTLKSSLDTYESTLTTATTNLSTQQSSLSGYITNSLKTGINDYIDCLSPRLTTISNRLRTFNTSLSTGFVNSYTSPYWITYNSQFSFLIERYKTLIGDLRNNAINVLWALYDILDVAKNVFNCVKDLRSQVGDFLSTYGTPFALFNPDVDLFDYTYGPVNFDMEFDRTHFGLGTGKVTIYGSFTIYHPLGIFLVMGSIPVRIKHIIWDYHDYTNLYPTTIIAPSGKALADINFWTDGQNPADLFQPRYDLTLTVMSDFTAFTYKVFFDILPAYFAGLYNTVKDRVKQKIKDNIPALTDLDSRLTTISDYISGLETDKLDKINTDLRDTTKSTLARRWDEFDTGFSTIKGNIEDPFRKLYDALLPICNTPYYDWTSQTWGNMLDFMSNFMSTLKNIMTTANNMSSDVLNISNATKNAVTALKTAVTL